MQWLYLSIAIASEVVGTTCLKLSDGFTKLWPSVGVVAAYSVTFVFLALTLKTLPVGIAYAVWAGVGIAAMALIGWLAFGQPLDGAALLGIALIVLGVVVLNGFSKSIAH
jgi:small multidrug resistance pump